MARFRRVSVLLLLLTLFAAGVVNAQEPVNEVTDDEVNQVAKELYCPICENTPLDVCETQACEDWRQLIREKLTDGQTEQEIIDYFAGIYGERARATPTTSGFSRFIWIAPVALSIIAGLFFARTVKGWLARGAEESATTTPAPTIPLGDLPKSDPELEEYIARLEREVKDVS